MPLYATLGELVAWIIGWDLILEYGVSVAAVAVGWGGYFNTLLDLAFGVALPEALSLPREEGGVLNLPAVFIVIAITALLVIGVRESARTNTVMVLIKVAVLVMFIALGLTALSADNYTPLFTGGFSGTFAGASLIGFDAISTSSEEVRDPGRTLPRASSAHSRSRRTRPRPSSLRRLACDRRPDLLPLRAHALASAAGGGAGRGGRADVDRRATDMVRPCGRSS